jgi:hypothetical protein
VCGVVEINGTWERVKVPKLRIADSRPAAGLRL